MKKPDCSDAGEVQHKDPRTFAHQLARVFRECRRVLKDEGVLAFSFHHSRPEGWAAIYEAIESAGFAVVAAHPVHAELRAASPKSAAKDPISIDAILVCKKLGEAAQRDKAKDTLFERVETVVCRLESADLRVSRGDRFVIGASQLLIDAGPEVLSYEEIRDRLETLRSQIFLEPRPDTLEAMHT